jgi:invasion protein IalB
MMSRILVAVLMSAFCLPAALAADGPAPLWHKSCPQTPDNLPCFVEQFAIAQPKNVPVLHIRFDLGGGDGKARMVVTTPLGIQLRPGLQLAVDGAKPIVLPFERCLGAGCDASAALDKAALEKFEKGKTLVVRYVVSDTASADIPIRLDGLADALKSLSK